MKTAWSMLLGLAVVFVLVVGVRAEGEEKKLEGKVTCAKCDLKLKGDDGKTIKDCYTVIKVKDDVYWFDKDSSKKYHKEICKEGKDGTVTGTVTEKDGKKWVKVAKLEYKE